ncbi:MAG: hypothetical protein JST92_22790, partial [Deltaproteobacteria bacterium]|nr:hypothetical protein [Deltaproteobacteria bacterium]
MHDALVHTYAQGKYQTDLPHAGVAPGQPVPPEAEETRTTGLRWLDYLVGLGLESVLTVLAWAVAGAVVIALLVWLARRLSLPQVKLEDDEGAPGAQPVLELAALRDAEELAAQGRFAEA